MPSIINAATSGGLISTADTSGVLQLQTASTTALTIDGSQNVGIGTSSPSTKLELNTASSYGGLRIKGTSSASNGFEMALSSDGVTGNFWLYENSAMRFATNGTERMRIDGSGNVGVGVTSPVTGTTTALLQVGGGILIPGNNLGLATNLYFQSGWKYSTNGSGGYISMSRSSTVAVEIGYATNNSSGAGAAASPVVAMSINTNGAVSLKDAVTTATGTGITFPATQSASSDANTLDDYEEGTWTPTDGSGAGLTFTVNTTSTYTKIGNMVYAVCSISFPSTANTVRARINGLPFGAASAGFWGATPRYTTSLNMIFGAINPTEAGIDLYTLNGGDITNASMSTRRVDLIIVYGV